MEGYGRREEFQEDLLLHSLQEKFHGSEERMKETQRRMREMTSYF